MGIRIGTDTSGNNTDLVDDDAGTVTLFVAGPNWATLPVAVFRYTSDHTDSQVAALSVLLIAISVSIMLLIERGVGIVRGGAMIAQ